jgi:2-polyprenyl-3-methyl-5-hydroxy-6-metoxy-1,4-benzoquinol methylase
VSVDLLAPPAAAAYWDTRHRSEGELRSGGDLTYDEATNAMFYTRRLGLLLDLLGTHSSPVAPLFLLDAGCGKGWFSRRLAAFGHRVDAIDASEAAIAHCLAHGLAAGNPCYARAELADWRSPWLYDAVIAVDVAFHLLDDDQWRRSMTNLADLVRLGGRLVVSDWGEAGRHAFGDYQLVRGHETYRPWARRCGLRVDGWRPYRFRVNPIGFYSFTRIG